MLRPPGDALEERRAVMATLKRIVGSIPLPT
jgi:hypothetical protein